jgi:hypothetical protein
MVMNYKKIIGLVLLVCLCVPKRSQAYPENRVRGSVRALLVLVRGVADFFSYDIQDGKQTGKKGDVFWRNAKRLRDLCDTAFIALDPRLPYGNSAQRAALVMRFSAAVKSCKDWTDFDQKPDRRKNIPIVPGAGVLALIIETLADFGAALCEDAHGPRITSDLLYTHADLPNVIARIASLAKTVCEGIDPDMPQEMKKKIMHQLLLKAAALPCEIIGDKQSLKHRPENYVELKERAGLRDLENCLGTSQSEIEAWLRTQPSIVGGLSVSKNWLKTQLGRLEDRTKKTIKWYGLGSCEYTIHYVIERNEFGFERSRRLDRLSAEAHQDVEYLQSDQVQRRIQGVIGALGEPADSARRVVIKPEEIAGLAYRLYRGNGKQLPVQNALDDTLAFIERLNPVDKQFVLSDGAARIILRPVIKPDRLQQLVFNRYELAVSRAQRVFKKGELPERPINLGEECAICQEVLLSAAAYDYEKGSMSGGIREWSDEQGRAMIQLECAHATCRECLIGCIDSAQQQQLSSVCAHCRAPIMEAAHAAVGKEYMHLEYRVENDPA